MYAVHPRHQTASQYTDGEDWGHTEDWGHIHTQTLTANRGHPRHQTASQYTDDEDWGHTEDWGHIHTHSVFDSTSSAVNKYNLQRINTKLECGPMPKVMVVHSPCRT